MKNAFTMIELIFVIVILGILAAVAIPKLTATRDDAKQSAILADFKNIITSISASAMASGNMSDLSIVYSVGGNILSVTSDKLEIGDPSGSGLSCATIDVSSGKDINVTIDNTTLNCILFDREADQEITVLGFQVTR